MHKNTPHISATVYDSFVINNIKKKILLQINSKLHVLKTKDYLVDETKNAPDLNQQFSQMSE